MIDPRAVLTLGDNQYEDGRFADFMDSYRPTWGRFKRRTHPTPGNHDYHVAGARGYFSYFGRRAHRRSGGMYSVSIGNWHVVSINTGNGLSDRKLRWVRRNLSNDRHRCELAFWHHPRWSSGSVHGSNPSCNPASADRTRRTVPRRDLPGVLIEQPAQLGIGLHDPADLAECPRRLQTVAGFNLSSPLNTLREHVHGLAAFERHGTHNTPPSQTSSGTSTA